MNMHADAEPARYRIAFVRGAAERKRDDLFADQPNKNVSVTENMYRQIHKSILRICKESADNTCTNRR